MLTRRPRVYPGHEMPHMGIASDMTGAHCTGKCIPCRPLARPVTNERERAITQELELPPELALLTADAVHGLGHVLEVLLQLGLEERAVVTLPQPALVERHRTRGLQSVVLDLQRPKRDATQQTDSPKC